MTIKPPAPPYVGPAAHTSAGSNQPIHRIVIHCTVSPCVKGGARATAAYFRTQASGGSAHYVVDPGEAVQVVYDDTIAWHAPPNQNSLGVELTDSLVSADWDHANAARWGDANHTAMLQHAADLVAQLALAYGVPIVKLSSADLVAGKHGICGHVDVSQAFHQSTHWDPGTTFPWATFMGLVKRAARDLQAKDKPAPKPVPAPVPHQLIKPSRRRVFHVKHGQHYYIEDSLRGVRLAVARLFGWIDLDCHKTSDGVLVIGHGPRPLSKGTTGGFVDPLGKVPANATYEELTWDEVSRLRSADGKGYRIRRADELVALAQKAGVNVELEAKSPYFTKADFAALFAAPGIDPKRVQVKAFTKFLPSLAAAHAAGAVTIVLTHNGQSKVPGTAKGFLNFYRGPKPTWI